MTETLEQLTRENAGLRAELTIVSALLDRAVTGATPDDHRILLATQHQREKLITERDALSADLATMQRKCQAAAAYITRLRRWLAVDGAALADLQEECENADNWAGHYARRAWAQRADNETLLAEKRRLSTQAAALAAEVERLTAVVAGQRQESALWHDLAQHHTLRADKALAEVESLTADMEYWRQAATAADGKCGTLQTVLNKALADLTDLNAAWHADRAAYLRLDGAGPEYVTTDSDGRVVHYGRGRVVDMNAADDAPDSDERLSGAAERNEATGLTNRATDAALRRLQAHDAATSAALGVTAHV